MEQAEITALQQAVLDLHQCRSEYVSTEPIVETFQGQTAWEGEVAIFSLIDHPTATRCYAWSHSLDEKEERRYFAVLHEDPVDSPLKAVRAAIVWESKGKE